MTDKDIEQQIQAKGKTAPRVTPEHIQNLIKSDHYFTAAQGAHQSIEDDQVNNPDDYPDYVPDELGLLTFCVLVLKNGFTVTGESACVSYENFDEGIGREIAYQNAIQKIWPLEGYLLKQKLSEAE